MDWRALQDVVTVAETGSLSAAARRLNVSQPTVGRRIEQLEEQLGALLFNRTARGLVLTKVGEGILGHAKQMEEGALAIERIAGERRVGDVVGIRRNFNSPHRLIA